MKKEGRTVLGIDATIPGYVTGEKSSQPTQEQFTLPLNIPSKQEIPVFSIDELIYGENSLQEVRPSAENVTSQEKPSYPGIDRYANIQPNAYKNAPHVGPHALPWSQAFSPKKAENHPNPSDIDDLIYPKQ